MAIDKSKWNTNVKVSQKTIDEIKKMGMAKALKTVAGASAASKQDASAKAWVEGVKRLYGANRVAEAVKAPAKKPATRSGVSSMDAAYAASKPKSVAKPKTTSSAKKPVSTTSNIATAAFNKLSPYGNKNQKFKSPISSSGAATRKSVPGKPSIGEQISSAIGNIGKQPTAAEVRKEMERRRKAAAKASNKK